MASRHDARLNELLIRLHRSLLQYVGECWPWVGGEKGAAEEQAITALVNKHQNATGALAELLAQRGWPINFGTYPVEYTDLHYVALDYLLGELLKEAESRTKELHAAAKELGDDAEAQAVLQQAAATETEIAGKLKEIRSWDKKAYLI